MKSFIAGFAPVFTDEDAPAVAEIPVAIVEPIEMTDEQKAQAAAILALGVHGITDEQIVSIGKALDAMVPGPEIIPNLNPSPEVIVNDNPTPA